MSLHALLIAIGCFAAVCWAYVGIRAIRHAQVREDIADAERPALTRPVVQHLSLSDRMRRKAAADAKRKADRIACQLAAHDFEFREAREADHVR